MAGIKIKIVQNIKAGTRSIVADTLSFDKEKLFVCVLFLFIKNFGY
jgi:hypothetical protein